MPNRPRLARFFERRLARRLVIAPFVFVVCGLVLLLSPLLFMVAFVADRFSTAPTSRTRLLLLVIGMLLIETVGLLVALALWFVTGFGQLGSPRWRWRLHRPLMGSYTGALLKLVSWALGVPVIWRDDADVSPGPVIMIARHTSFLDAIIPAAVMAGRSGLIPHHVVTHGLRYLPCIDVVGHRLPNSFIKRTPGEGSSELGAIERIGEVLADNSGAIIFPEGTFRTEARFEQALRRLGRRNAAVAARAARFEHVLPPRPSGTYALLQGAPQADVVVCTNTGFEAFGSLRDIVGRFRSDRPIVIGTWRIDRDDIPSDAAGFDDWLFGEFERIDGWVRAQRSSAVLG